MKVLQINSVINTGSTGRIVEDIGQILIAGGHESYIAYGRGKHKSKSRLIRIGSAFDIYLHGLYTLLTDRHGFASKRATREFINKIDQVKPDLIILHNIHGYYLNIEVLFNYLQTTDKPVVWTLHDAWPFTGHCAYYENFNCYKWKTECFQCPKTRYYPKSYFDNSRLNFHDKKRLFTSIRNLTLVTPSDWLNNHVEKSFLGIFPTRTINNGIDTGVFVPDAESSLAADRKYLLFVANVWTKSKGLGDIFSLRNFIDSSIDFLVVGLTQRQAKSMPPGITGIKRISEAGQLVKLYSGAYCFINPTYSDNFPTVNLEALSCGTPVITYRTGGSPEAVNAETGFVVERGDLNGIAESLEKLGKLNYQDLSKACRERAVALFDKNKKFQEYLNMFQELVGIGSSVEVL